MGQAIGGTSEVWVLRILDVLPRLQIMQRLSNEQQKLCDKQMSFKNMTQLLSDTVPLTKWTGIKSFFEETVVSGFIFFFFTYMRKKYCRV